MQTWDLLLIAIPVLVFAQAIVIIPLHRWLGNFPGKPPLLTVYCIATVFSFCFAFLFYFVFSALAGFIETPTAAAAKFSAVWLVVGGVCCVLANLGARKKFIEHACIAMLLALPGSAFFAMGYSGFTDRIGVLKNGERVQAIQIDYKYGGHKNMPSLVLGLPEWHTVWESAFVLPDCPIGDCPVYAMRGKYVRGYSPHLTFLFMGLSEVFFGAAILAAAAVKLRDSYCTWRGRAPPPRGLMGWLLVLIFLLWIGTTLASVVLSNYPHARWPV